jgi:hypothetical protein
MAVTSASPRAAEAPRTSMSAAAEQRAVFALLAGYVLCFALLPVGIDNAFGLPAHPLFLHVPVVLIPLLVLATIPLVARPAWRERYGLAWGTLGVAALAGTVLTASAGEKFIEEQRFVSSVLHDHQEAGDTLRILMFVFVALILVTIVRDWRARRGAPLGGAAIGAGLSVVVLLLAAATGFFVVRTGHLGSKATWGDESREAGERGAPPPGAAPGGQQGEGGEQGEGGP